MLRTDQRPIDYERQGWEAASVGDAMGGDEHRGPDANSPLLSPYAVPSSQVRLVDCAAC